MSPDRVGETATHTVDARLYGVPGALSLYVLDTPRPVVVDAGAATTTGAVLDALDELDIDTGDVAAVLVTHVHLDHAGGAGELAREWPNATVHVHERGYDYLTDAERLAGLRESVDRATGQGDAFGEPELVPSDRCVSVSGGERIDAGDRDLELVDAPGHAPHHYAVWDPVDRVMFSIDAAGMWFDGQLKPTTPPPGFDLATNVETARRLATYGPAVNCYGHFGPGGEDAVGELERYADLLPEWVGLVATLREEHGDDVSAIVGALDTRWRSPTVQRDVAGVLRYLDETDDATLERLLPADAP